MKHLIISRELPPASYGAGGIGTYVANIMQLLVDRGETVHVIGERWAQAPRELEVRCHGNLIIHRVGSEDIPRVLGGANAARMKQELAGLKETTFPAQWFAWSAGFLAERLIDEEGIDVVEAQEWEAPLYYFLLRRSIGLGPTRKPPCIVHLHSPSAIIHHYNGPPSAPPGLVVTDRMEEFCIRSADALLCPSGTLAEQAAGRFQVPRDRINVIPLPIGIIPRVERDAEVWSRGSVCFVGRLEPRKGVIEWVDAAVRVARSHPEAHFDFVGANSWNNLQAELSKEIPAELTARFRFHGPKSKKEIAFHLSRSNAAVVPSRWENFPNTCIEAMSSGLPVITTRFGGMVELVEDGRSGWLAENTGVAGLTDSLTRALERCLSTTPEKKAVMGAEASEAVRRVCNNARVAEAHQKFRRAIASQGSIRSSIPASKNSAVAPPNIVIRSRSLQEGEKLIRKLGTQTMLPQAIAVVYEIPSPEDAIERLRANTSVHLILHHAPNITGPQGWNEGASLLRSCPAPGFWLFLDHADALEPDCLAQMAAVFANRSDIGIVTLWTERLGPRPFLDVRPSPALAQQMIENDVAPASGFRSEAIQGSAPFRLGLPREYDVWALSNEVMAKGWNGVTLPCLLARRLPLVEKSSRARNTALRAIRAEALSAFDTEANRLALRIVNSYVPLLSPSHVDNEDQPIRRLLLRALETLLLRPSDFPRRILAFAKRQSTRVRS